MKSLLHFLALSFLLTPACFAEHLCRASVSYAWQREKDTTKIMVFASRVEAKGIDEAAAKAALEARAERDKTKAAEQCVREHENQAGCIAAKVNFMATALSSLTFSARKMLEESIAADCKAQQGRCSGPELSEPKCSEIVVATKADAKDSGKDASEKSAAKKKK